MKTQSSILLFSAILICFTAIQCTPQNDRTGNPLIHLQEWTVDHHLTIQEPNDVLIGRIFHIDITSEGHIITGDISENHFLEFNSQGDFLGTISQRGSGPGENEQISSFFINNNDELVLHDGRTMRITLFKNEQDSWRHHQMHALDNSETSIGTIYPGPDSESLFAANSISINYNNVHQDAIYRVVNQVDLTGHTISDSLARGQFDNFLINMSSDFFTIRGFPGSMGINSYFTVIDQRYIISATNNEFRITIYDHQTGEQSQIHYDIPKNELTQREQQDLLDQAGQNFRSSMREKMPQHHPVIHQLLSDDNQQIWVQITPVDNDQNEDLNESIPNWLILNLDGDLLGKLYLPTDLNVRQIRNHQIYAVNAPDDDAPTIEVFRYTTH